MFEQLLNALYGKALKDFWGLYGRSEETRRTAIVISLSYEVHDAVNV